ncbi:hypothetical protein JTB14_037939 [Gonioctena quinquepunctata]|nr:hypothetical protein JTB14_037939 [Gonioctena quinquepunctata]
MKVLHANIRSLRNKIDELEAFIADKQIDIICLTEHWMSESEITTTQLQGYRLAAFSARLQTTGRGTCIFIKDSVLNQLGTAKQVILAGDFNINLCNVDSSKLQDILNSANLKQAIYRPTRGNNCIDNIFLDSEILLQTNYTER